MPKIGYQCGLAGVSYLPKVLVSMLPEVVDFSDTEKVAKFLAFLPNAVLKTKDFSPCILIYIVLHAN